MSGPDSYSWSRVVHDSNTPALFNNGRQEFTWKTVKKGRLRPSTALPTEQCDREHCRALLHRCWKMNCSDRIHRQLSILQSENDALAAAFSQRLSHIEKLSVEISANCNMEEYYSAENEESRMALSTAQQAKATETDCKCISCQLAYERKETLVLNERLSAAQLRSEVLRDYRIANEKEAVEWTAPRSNQSAKYFTPVGTAKGRGVSALRPTLQMQNSYDVAALTTNSMVNRPLKTPKDEKSKQLPAGLSKAD